MTNLCLRSVWVGWDSTIKLIKVSSMKLEASKKETVNSILHIKTGGQTVNLSRRFKTDERKHLFIQHIITLGNIQPQVLALAASLEGIKKD